MKKASLLYIILLLLASCSQGDLFSLADSSSGKEVKVHLSLCTTPMKMGDVETRSSAPIVDEATITSLRVIQFDNKGKFVKNTLYQISDINDVDVTLIGGMTSNVYFIANCSNPSFKNLNTRTIQQESDINNMVENDLAETSYIVADGKTPAIPMFGSINGQVVPASGNVPELKVELARMLARVDLVYNMTPAAMTKMSLNSIRVCNVPKQLSYRLTNDATFPAISAETQLQNFDSEMTVVNSATPTMLTFYLPENRRGTSATTVDSYKSKIGIPFATYFELISSDCTFKIYPGANTLNDYNIERNKHYTLNATISGISASDLRIKEIPKSNCYLVNAGESVTIPISRANESDLGIQIANLRNPNCTASIYWSTSSDLVEVKNETCQGATYTVNTKAGANGNAVVCIKDNVSKNILWSWHIWVSSTVPSSITVGSTTIMDRNLGASDVPGPNKSFSVCAGLQYQWGRKDPFMPYINYANEVLPMQVVNLGTPIGKKSTFTGDNTYISSGGSLAQSVASPITLFSGWMTYPLAWGNKRIKSVYDPCPIGWHVTEAVNGNLAIKDPVKPTAQTLDYFVDIKNGFGNFSACGFRKSNGELSNMGIGQYWMSAGGGTGPYSTFNEYSYSGRVTSADYKSRAMSIRCEKTDF